MTNDTMTILPAGPVSNGRMRIEVVKGILWQDWLAHGNLFLWMLAIWLIGQWVLMAFTNCIWIMFFGLVLAKVMGTGLGGKEAREGSEEFAFALPPTRGQRYLVRMVVGLTCILFFSGMSFLAINFNLPQKFWGLFVDSGFTQPFRQDSESIVRGWYWGILVPPTIFCPFFAAGVCRREIVWNIVFYAIFFLATVGIMQLYKFFTASYPPDAIIAALFLITGFSMLLIGYFIYTRKEGIVPATFVPLVRRTGKGMWVIVVLLVIFALWLAGSYIAYSTRHGMSRNLNLQEMSRKEHKAVRIISTQRSIRIEK